jgi:hypothetical protein
MGEVSFEVGEVLEIKGWFFKIVLVDPFTSKICLKKVSDLEARETMVSMPQAESGKGVNDKDCRK